MEHIYTKTTIVEHVSFAPHQIGKNLDSLIYDYIRNKIGNKCVEEGFVRADDIKVLGRTIGVLDATHFTGNIKYNVECVVNVLNPPEGCIIYCKVININAMGTVLEVIGQEPSPIRVLLAREHHQENEIFNSLQVDDEVYVEIIAKRYEYNDTQIQAIGVLSDKEEMLKQYPQFLYDLKKVGIDAKELHSPMYDETLYTEELQDSMSPPQSPKYDPYGSDQEDEIIDSSELEPKINE